MFEFEIEKKSKKSEARIGRIKTPHGDIVTPAFLPVATFGVVKGGLDFSDNEKIDSQCQITNTFHFLDLNKADEVEKLGGLHQYFRFDKPIFTDSGGFQVFSLGKGLEHGLGKVGSIFPKYGEEERKTYGKLVKKINRKGVLFNSPHDGREIYLTPELSAETQMKLGADFIYLFDACGSPLDNLETAKREMELTNHWFERFLNIKIPGRQRVFGIIQGGLFQELREKSTKFVNELDVFGIAIGGALGKDKKEMYKTISWVNKYIDWKRPHHLLGIGDLDTMERIIKLGIDLFDCALPTRIARHGIAFTSKGYLDLSRNRIEDRFNPIEQNCQCFVCQNYSRTQINFLFKAKEVLGGRLLTIHNLWFIERRLEEIRKKIRMNKF